MGAEQIREVPLWVGRDRLLVDLRDDLLVRQRKVLVLVGQGGIGKTSLAVKLMEACGVALETRTLQVDCAFERVLYCEVSESIGFDGIAARFGEALGLDVKLMVPGQTIEAIVAGLSRHRWLVVLDNVESILEPGTEGRSCSEVMAQFLNRLAYGGHRSQIVITSRELPMDLADRRGKRIDRKLVRVEMIMGISVTDSIALLQDYAPEVSVADLRWVADRVGGQVFVLTQLGNLLAETSIAYLRKHPELVTTEAEPILREQIDRLDESACELLKRMSVLRVPMGEVGLTFLRSCSWDGSEIHKPEDELVNTKLKETRSLLKRIVDCSLIQETHDSQIGETSYSLHPVMAEFLRQEYEDELPLLFRYAALFYGSIAYIEDFTCFEQLESILEEMYCWWNMGMEEKVAEIAIESFPGMLRPWGKWEILREWMARVLPYAEGSLRRDCLRSIGAFYRDTGDWTKAEVYFKEALMLAEQEDSKAGRAASWGVLGNIERKRGNWDAAEQLFRQSLQLWEELGDRSGMASSWGVLGDIERKRGNWDAAELLYRQCLQVEEELGDRSGMAWVTSDRGANELGRGNLELAESLLLESLNQSQSLEMKDLMAETNGYLAQLYHAKNNPELAQQHYTIAHQLYTQLGAVKEIETLEAWRTEDGRERTEEG